MTVWIAQCLCPMRHAILAASGEAADEAEAIKEFRNPLAEGIALALRIGVLNPWCSICNAKPETWDIELGRTSFATMAEAEPSLRKLQDEQMATRALFGDMKGPKH
jgi:hypothetical protein